VSPVVLGGIAAAAGGALLVGIGAVAASPALRLLARRLARSHRDLRRYRRQLAQYEHDLDVAKTEVRDLAEAVAELREGIPKVWDEAFKASQQTDEWTLVAAEVQRRQREHGGGRS